jgi:hypothetical protein
MEESELYMKMKSNKRKREEKKKQQQPNHRDYVAKEINSFLIARAERKLAHNAEAKAKVNSPSHHHYMPRTRPRSVLIQHPASSSSSITNNVSCSFHRPPAARIASDSSPCAVR